jgi:hypothetical protein
MRRYLPVLTLFILSPWVAEVLFGATPLSRIGALLVVAPLYGGGAILVRELARRRGPGWGRIFLLGAAYGVIEEGLAIQSIFNPNLFNAGSIGGRALDVNWVWTMWTIGYHIVWSIGIPILLAELLFPARRNEPWLGRVGMIIVGVLYVLGLLAIAAIYRFAIAPDFKPPLLPNLFAALIAILLVVSALTRPARTFEELSNRPAGKVPSPWIISLLGFLMAVFWFGLLNLPQPLRTGVWVLVPIVLDIALLIGFASLVQRWSSDEAWNDLHRLALIFGPLIMVMLSGSLFVTAGNRLDQLGVGIFGIVTIILLSFFARRLQHRVLASKFVS